MNQVLLSKTLVMPFARILKVNKVRGSLQSDLVSFINGITSRKAIYHSQDNKLEWWSKLIQIRNKQIGLCFLLGLRDLGCPIWSVTSCSWRGKCGWVVGASNSLCNYIHWVQSYNLLRMYMFEELRLPILRLQYVYCTYILMFN